MYHFCGWITDSNDTSVMLLLYSKCWLTISAVSTTHSAANFAIFRAPLIFPSFRFEYASSIAAFRRCSIASRCLPNHCFGSVDCFVISTNRTNIQTHSRSDLMRSKTLDKQTIYLSSSTINNFITKTCFPYTWIIMELHSPNFPLVKLGLFIVYNKTISIELEH